MPISPNISRELRALPAEKLMSRNKLKSIRGGSRRFSTSTKVMKPTRLAAKRPSMRAEPQPYFCPSTSANVRQSKAIEAIAMPGQSILRLALGSVDSVIIRMPATTA